MAKQTSDVLTALVVGTDGTVWVSWVVGTETCNGPVRISGLNLFPPGAPIAMAKQTDNILTALAVGNDGRLNVAWVVDTQPWNGPVAFGVPFAPPDASVAMARQTGDPLTAVVVGNDGGLWVAWVVGTSAWAGPVKIGNIRGLFPSGASVALTNQTNHILTAMAVDNNQRVNVAWVVGTGALGWADANLSFGTLQNSGNG